MYSLTLPLQFWSFHVFTILCLMTPFKTHWINSKMHGGQSENKTVFLSSWETVIWEIWGFHLTATIFQSTHSEYWSKLWRMCKVTANCDQNWAMPNVYRSLTLFCSLAVCAVCTANVRQPLTHIQASRRTFEMMVQREMLPCMAADPTNPSTPAASTPTCSASEPAAASFWWGQTIWSG